MRENRISRMEKSINEWKMHGPYNLWMFQREFFPSSHPSSNVQVDARPTINASHRWFIRWKACQRDSISDEILPFVRKTLDWDAGWENQRIKNYYVIRNKSWGEDLRSRKLFPQFSQAQRKFIDQSSIHSCRTTVSEPISVTLIFKLHLLTYKLLKTQFFHVSVQRENLEHYFSRGVEEDCESDTFQRATLRKRLEGVAFLAGV